ncbi:hypothetical protein LTR95_000400 [Oleoguttula sp. CCFEE 5521]
MHFFLQDHVFDLQVEQGYHPLHDFEQDHNPMYDVDQDHLDKAHNPVHHIDLEVEGHDTLHYVEQDHIDQVEDYHALHDLDLVHPSATGHDLEEEHETLHDLDLAYTLSKTMTWYVPPPVSTSTKSSSKCSTSTSLPIWSTKTWPTVYYPTETLSFVTKSATPSTVSTWYAPPTLPPLINTTTPCPTTRSASTVWTSTTSTTRITQTPSPSKYTPANPTATGAAGRVSIEAGGLLVMVLLGGAAVMV